MQNSFGFPVEPDVYKIKRGSSEFCLLILHSLDCFFETSSSYQISVLLSKYAFDSVLLTTIIFFILS